VVEISGLSEITVALLETFDRAGWHTDLNRALEGLTAEQALWRPAPGQHCIWDHVNHLTAWTEELCRTLSGEPPRRELYETLEPGWPPPQSTDQAGWDAAVARLKGAHRNLVDTVARMTAGELAQRSKKGVPRAVRIIGCANHYSYHGGQVILLRRLQGTWEPER